MGLLILLLSLTQNDTSVIHTRGQIGCLANARGDLPFKGDVGRPQTLLYCNRMLLLPGDPVTF